MYVFCSVKCANSRLNNFATSKGSGDRIFLSAVNSIKDTEIYVSKKKHTVLLLCVFVILISIK